MAKLNYKADEFSIVSAEEMDKSLDEKLWLVIRKTTFKDNLGYRIREGDLIKFGKVMFRIKELKSDKRTNQNPNKVLTEMNHQVQAQTIVLSKPKNNNKTSPICRICLMDENDQENPLINPCKCIGSVRYIHLLCIRQWLKSKITTKMFTFLTVHSYKHNLECEICKSPVPEKIKFRNENLQLLDYVKPETDYIALESVTRDKKETKYFYIIHMDEKKSICLGRSNDCDVRMTDISVSRFHAEFHLIDGLFYLQDFNSKFGTYSKVQHDITILPGKDIGFQSGRIFLSFSLNKTCFAWIRCYSNKFVEKLDYNSHFESKILTDYQKDLDSMQVMDTDYSKYESEKAPSLKEETPVHKLEEKLAIEEDCKNESEGELSPGGANFKSRHFKNNFKYMKILNTNSSVVNLINDKEVSFEYNELEESRQDMDFNNSRSILNLNNKNDVTVFKYSQFDKNPIEDNPDLENGKLNPNSVVFKGTNELNNVPPNTKSKTNIIFSNKLKYLLKNESENKQENGKTTDDLFNGGVLVIKDYNEDL